MATDLDTKATHMADDRCDFATLTVNGGDHDVKAAPTTPLLYILRNDLALNGPKFGCGLGECGACMVLIEEKPVRACTVPLRAVRGRPVTTLEGLGHRDAIHPVQAAFIAENAAQCGYCLNGMIIATAGLLMRNPEPTDVQVRDALRHNLCRCGTHLEILKAVHRAAAAMQALRASRDEPRSQSMQAVTEVVSS